MACASAGKRDMMNQPGHGGDVPVAKRRRCVEPTGAAAAGIPEDIVEEILLRLPVKSILRFRSVCKSWRAMVADPRFVRLQLHHSTTAARHYPPSMLILADWCLPEQRRGAIDFFSYPGHGVAADSALGMTWSSKSTVAAAADGYAAADGDAVDVGNADDNLDAAVDDGNAAADWDDDDDWDIDVGAIGWALHLHCNGLVLLRSMRKYSTKMLVCNPATKELAELPACAPDYFGVQAVGFYADQSTGKTKVVHCFIRHCDKTYTDYSVGCEVLSLGSPAWRPLADPPYLVKTKTSPSTGSCTTPGIVRFDMCSEEFASFPCPPFMERQKMSDIACGELTELGGKLCYVHAPADDRVELWTASAADGGGSRPRWSLQCTVVLPHSFHTFFQFTYDYQGGICFYVDYAMIYRYDVERRVVERVVDMLEEMTYFDSSRCKLYRCDGDWMHHAIQYSESLVSIQAN
ncbi:putative F-box/kelch-repeat protein At3g17280 [Oryza sativa Japonica Group]|uniref:putative F-box/kelch-repeat protein At3g17280 n=1 Tax=Oryza sativa subsp. japonica TaxID=39947 RepID=UPI00339C801D